MPDSTLAPWIRPGMMLPELAARTAEGVLEEIAGGMSRASPAVSAPAAFAAFLEREALGTTAVGDGFAIPHCRLGSIPQVLLAVARQPLGVDFGALDGKPVHTFFAIVAPRAAASAHLGALGAIARFLRAPGNRQLVEEARGNEELLAILLGAVPAVEDPRNG